MNTARGALSAALLLPVLALAACSSNTTGSSQPPARAGSTPPASSTSTSTAPPPAATIALAPTAAKDVDPAAPITATATGGRITNAVLTNTVSKLVVKGSLSNGGAMWTAGEDLGYGKHYRLTATAENAAGVPVTRTIRFATLAPRAQSAVHLDTIYGNAMVDKATYGIGMIPVVSFDAAPANKKAAERALHVTTSPHVEGSWTWATATTLHWRPKAYYQPGTTVTIAANVYGVNLGDGVYGASDESTSFTIGQRHISVADDTTHQVKVYFAGKLVHTMPTSMGKHEGEWVGGRYISFWTMDGTYTVIGHENPATMSSASYGLPLGAPGSYPPEKIYWSTKISTDGIYLHELDSTVQYQGHSDTSHGCLNLDHANAEWFFEHSRVGDVVEIRHNGGPKITLAQGGDWSVPWSTWVAGSALR